MRFESLNRKPTLHERLPRHHLPIPSTRALCMGTAREREEVRTARMHPGSANDVSANADERKNTTVRSALRALNFFFFVLERNDALKIMNSLFLGKQRQNSHTDTKIQREHAHVKNDASTSTHFNAHPYTRKRNSHTRDCNLNVLNTSDNIHLPFYIFVFLSFRLLLFRYCVCRKTDTRLLTHNERHRTRKRHKRAKKRDRRRFARL